MAEYLQRVPLDASINWCHLHQIARKIIQKHQIWDNTGSIQKHLSAGIWKRILETYWLQKDNQRRPPKLSFQQNKNILRQTKRLWEEMGNFYVKKRVMIKVGILPSISKETNLKVLRKTDRPEMNLFLQEKNSNQKWLELRLKFGQIIFWKLAVPDWNMKSSESLWYYRE